MLPRCLLKLLLSLLFVTGGLHAQDQGKDKIGTIKTELIFASESEPGEIGKVTKLDGEELKRLAASDSFSKFKHFRRLGSDVKPIFRGYENWASPLEGSDTIMVSFQPQLRTNGKLRLDLELWQSKKKVLRTDPTLEKGKRVYILGPKWRDGNLIITVELVDLKSK